MMIVSRLTAASARGTGSTSARITATAHATSSPYSLASPWRPAARRRPAPRPAPSGATATKTSARRRDRARRRRRRRAARRERGQADDELCRHQALLPSTQYTRVGVRHVRQCVDGQRPSAPRAHNPARQRHGADRHRAGQRLDRARLDEPGRRRFAGVRVCRATGTTDPTPCGIKLAKPASSYVDSTGLAPSTQYTYADLRLRHLRRRCERRPRLGHHGRHTARNVTGLTATVLSASRSN